MYLLKRKLLQEEVYNMARKTPLITDQIAALEKENERLTTLQKLFEKAVKFEFGMDTKSIHGLIDKRTKTDNNSSPESSDFEQQICSYFDLYLLSDKDDFLRIMCSEKSLNYYKKQLHSDGYSDDLKDALSVDNDNFSDDYNYDYSGGNE